MNVGHAKRTVAVVVACAPAAVARKAAAVAVPLVRAAAVHAAAHSKRLAVVAAPVRKAVVADINATTTHNHRAPTPTWAPIPATAIRAIAVPAAQEANQIQCVPAWTAWQNAAAGVAVATAAEIREVAAMADRVAVVAGATGLVGQAVLAALLTAEVTAGRGADCQWQGDAAPGLAGPDAAPSVQTVHVLYGLGRRKPASDHPRLQLHAVDFAALPALPPVDDVYIALGTTMAVAGNPQAFRAVDYDAVMATAHAARAAGATRCGVVSAMGANPRSRIFYNRVKGEVERDLRALGFNTLVIARPALLMGDRMALQQAPRPAESLSKRLFRWVNPLVPHNYRARPAADVAHALVRAVQSAPPGQHVLSGKALQPLR